jgi:dTDP-4-dehydrorhamnose 3,5-epimerase
VGYNFQFGAIDGVVWKVLKKNGDERGWLCELFRHDETVLIPAMVYASETLPGIARGPHEHEYQTDYFFFFGPSNFMVWLWDTRKKSATFQMKQLEVVGANSPRSLIVPPGVVHAYRNIGDVPGLVVNCPNRLYKGVGKKRRVDEIRHEDVAGSPFVLI